MAHRNSWFTELKDFSSSQTLTVFFAMHPVPRSSALKRDAWALGFCAALKMATFWVGSPSYSAWLNLQCMSSFNLYTQFFSWSINSNVFKPGDLSGTTRDKPIENRPAATKLKITGKSLRGGVSAVAWFFHIKISGRSKALLIHLPNRWYHTRWCPVVS